MSSYLFVYGTLRSDAGMMQNMLTAVASLVAPATARGELYAVGEFLRIGPSPGQPGSRRRRAVRVSPGQARSGLRILDSYEGITDENRSTHDFVETS